MSVARMVELTVVQMETTMAVRRVALRVKQKVVWKVE